MAQINLQGLDYILKSSKCNLWYKETHIELYIRNSPRMFLFNKEINKWNTLQTFQIAQVKTNPRGQGIYTEFLTNLEKILKEKYNNIDAIFIENILDKRFYEFHLKQGYILSNNDILLPCVVKVLKPIIRNLTN